MCIRDSGCSSCQTLPEVSIHYRLQRLFFWLCLFFIWGGAYAEERIGAMKTRPESTLRDTAIGDLDRTLPIAQASFLFGSTRDATTHMLNDKPFLLDRRGCWVSFLPPLAHPSALHGFCSPYRRHGEASHPGPHPFPCLLYTSPSPRDA